MKRKAQITMFIIVGIVLLMSIAFIYYLLTASSPNAPGSEVESDVTGARTCLSQATRSAIGSLVGDSLVTVNEGGLMEETPIPHVMIQEGDTSESYGGVNNYQGLCRPENVGCNPFAYHYASSTPSNQQAMQVAISQEMSECIETEGVAQVNFLPDSMVVSWEEPNIEHVEFTSLHDAYAWLGSEINQELANYYNLFGETEINERFRAELIVNADHPVKSSEYPYDTYELKDSSTTYATFTIENRPPMWWSDNEADSRYYKDDEMEELAVEYECNEDECTISVYNLDEDATQVRLEDSAGNGLAFDDGRMCNFNPGTRPCRSVFELVSTQPEANPVEIKVLPRCENNGLYILVIEDVVGRELEIPIRANDPEIGDQESCGTPV